MSAHDIALLGRRMQEIRDQYEEAIKLIAAGRLRGLGLDPDTEELDGREVALEAHVRTYCIDPLLEALGWNLRTPALLRMLSLRMLLNRRDRMEIDASSTTTDEVARVGSHFW